MRQLALDYSGSVPDYTATLAADTDDLAILKDRGQRFLRGWLKVKHRGADPRSVEALVHRLNAKLHG